jgi:carbonic anhydrase
MKRPLKVLLSFVGLILVVGFVFFGNQRLRFLVGGALVNLGFRFQDPLQSFDFDHEENITPDEVWKEVLSQNRLASSVRKRFPRTSRHPVVAMVACMDARIDTSELTGDTRKYYYVVRTAGSVMSEKEEEMLELAVENGVKLVVWTRHSDCAAEKAATSPVAREHFPFLTTAIDERDKRVREFLERPHIAARIAEGKLLVKVINIDTMTEEMVPPGTPMPSVAHAAH